MKRGDLFVVFWDRMVADAATVILRKVREDSTQYPALVGCRSWEDLHSVVDANQYIVDVVLPVIGEPDWSSDCHRVRFVNAVTAAVDAALVGGWS